MPPKPSTSSNKLSIPAFIKFLTANVGLSPQDALSITSALVKNGYATSSSSSSSSDEAFNPFVGVTESRLVSIGITDPDIRKVLCAYGRTGRKSSSTVAGGSLNDAGKTLITEGGQGYGRKRKSREHDLDTPLPTKQEDKIAIPLEFGEVEEDYLLHDRSVVVNRAPVMTAWATIVAERLGFTRQEALSVAHTYTNMNAASKGVSLGIYSPEKGKQKTEVGPSQPYVDVMGRKIPVLALQNGEWRGVANGAVAEPEQAFGYIQRSFRQNMSATMGALRLLAESFEPDELNKLGYQLYAEFRPEVSGWGQRGHLHLGRVLDLRKKAKTEEGGLTEGGGSGETPNRSVAGDAGDEQTVAAPGDAGSAERVIPDTGGGTGREETETASNQPADVPCGSVKEEGEEGTRGQDSKPTLAGAEQNAESVHAPVKIEE